MARRREDWNVGLAQDLRDPEFAREFLLGAVEEGIAVQVALGKTPPHEIALARDRYRALLKKRAEDAKKK